MLIGYNEPNLWYEEPFLTNSMETYLKAVLRTGQYRWKWNSATNRQRRLEWVIQTCTTNSSHSIYYSLLPHVSATGYGHLQVAINLSASSCVSDSCKEDVNIKCGISSFYVNHSVVLKPNHKDAHDPERHILNRRTLQKINKKLNYRNIYIPFRNAKCTSHVSVRITMYW